MDYDFQNAKELGINPGSAVGFIPHKEVNGKIVLDLAKAEAQLAQDAAMATVPNIGAPAAIYTYIDPRIIPILFAVMNSQKFFADQKMGDFEDEFIIFKMAEMAGQIGPYNDFGDGPTTDTNYEFASRGNFRYQTAIKYGDLEVAKATKAKLNLVADKQRAAAEIMARARNSFNLFGVKGQPIYGMMNDPNLGASLTPVSVNGKSTWADKVAGNSAEAANIIFNDVNKLVNELMANNGGLIDQNASFKLGISNKMYSYLTIPNTYGKTAQTLLQENYPNMTFVQLPELSTAQGEMLYMTVDSVSGVDTGNLAYSQAFGMGRLIAYMSHFAQKATAATSGAIIYRPSAVATMLGI